MTLILALANRRQAIQLSDRRLSCDGRIKDDHSNKATVVVCANGRFAVGYTGLAIYRNFRTQEWLLDSLCECGPPEFGMGELISRFIRKARHDFANRPDLRELKPGEKRLTVIFTGFLYRPKPLVANVMVSNFQDWCTQTDRTEATPDFLASWERQRDDATSSSPLVQRVGQWKSIPSEDLDQLRGMLSEEKPQHAIVEKGCVVMRKAADHPGGKTVGKDIMSVVIPSDLAAEVSAIFMPYSAADVMVFPDQVTVSPAISLAVKDCTFRPATPVPGEPFLRPRLRKNQLCWCGSKKRFKGCHGGSGNG